nr:hypothetical protein [uncultured Rhodopila sp.]
MPRRLTGAAIAGQVLPAIARRVRTRALTEAEARASFANLDQWTRKFAQCVEIAPGGIAMAAGFIRRLDRTLRAPDAIRIAITRGSNSPSRYLITGWEPAPRRPV